MFLPKKYLRFYFPKTITEAQSVVYIDQQKKYRYVSSCTSTEVETAVPSAGGLERVRGRRLCVAYKIPHV